MLPIRKSIRLLAVVLFLCQTIFAAPSQKWWERKANE